MRSRSSKMSVKIFYFSIFVWSVIVAVTAQSQNISRTINPGSTNQGSANQDPIARQRALISQSRGTANGQRRVLMQSRGRLPQEQSLTNIRNQQRTPARTPILTQGRIPRARTFQASLPNMVPNRLVPTRMVPTRAESRLVTRSRGLPAGSQRMGTVTAGSRSPSRSINQNALLSTICAPPRSVRCFSWPRNRDARGAYMCDGGCVSRTCPIPCECSCVDPRLIGRLRATGRISGPELTLIDTRLIDSLRRRQERNRIIAARATQPRGTQTQRGTSTDTRVRTNEPSQRRDTLPGLNFGISDDVLATLIAQPALNEIVGPQGINQILAGEPPPLLSLEDRRQRSSSSTSSAPTSTVRQPEIRIVETSSTRAQQRGENPTQSQNIGIPVPLSRLNFDLSAQRHPAMGNMRVMVSDIRPFDANVTPLHNTSRGVNIDLPNPSPVNLSPSATDNTVSVRRLPGTNVLFVDLTRSPPSNQGSNPRMLRTPTQIGRVRDRSRGFVNNITASDVRSDNLNNVPVALSNQTIPGSFRTDFGGSIQTFVEGTVQAADPLLRAPTQDECLAQRLELWCDPQKPWEGTPGLPRWCLLNCRADNCDNQRCACACIEEILFKSKFEQLKQRSS